MSDLDTALQRLGNAVTALESALAQQDRGEDIIGDVSPELPVLRAERDKLVGEVQALRRRASKDAELRQEAASAVREALRDLRGAVGQEASNA